MNAEILTDKIRNEINACERKKIDAQKQMSRYAATIEVLEEQKFVLMEILEKAESGERRQIAEYDDELNGNRGLNHLNEHLMKINRFARRELTAEEVYLFDVILCDNDIDRDGECFSEAALEQMKGLFVGKTGIFDHDPRSSGQTARVFDTEIVRDPQKKTSDGRPYVCLKAQAYMVRTQANADLICEIEGGIKKEASISCCAAKRICSVCGADRRESACGHIDGRMYGEKQCHTILDNIIDAYEWSFVSVPVPVKKQRKEDGKND